MALPHFFTLVCAVGANITSLNETVADLRGQGGGVKEKRNR